MDYLEMQNALHALDGMHGVRLETLGRSILGREIPMVMLGEGSRFVVYVAGIHGDEREGTAALLELARDYADSLARRANIFSVSMSYLCENRTICLVPMLNPDGVGYVTEGVSAENPLRERLAGMNGGSADFSAWRANARGVDLAHNFGAGFLSHKHRELAEGITGGAPSGHGGEYPESEPESAALAGLLREGREQLLGVLTLQKGSGYIECGCEDNLSAKCMAVGRALSRACGFPLARPETLKPDGSVVDFCIRTLARPAYALCCENGQPQRLFYAQLRRALFTFPVLI